jgi:hypothetical protein
VQSAASMVCGQYPGLRKRRRLVKTAQRANDPQETMMSTDDNDQQNGKGTKAIILIAMVLAAITAVFGALAVYKAVFVYTIVP